jgi:hypothetical protein
MKMTRTGFKRVGFSKRWDDRGVASTVGTIMAIMVILALLSLVTNHYVPVWMEDSESNHIELALSQLSSFKTTMDNQMLFAEVLHETGKEFTSTPVYTAVKLGSDGVPVFASPTHGELGINTDEGDVSVSFMDDQNGTNDHIQTNVNGNIELWVPNRYFVPQTLTYENGAILRYQNDGEIVIADPHFSISNKTGSGSESYEVSINLIWLFGVGSASGSGVEGITSKLLGMDFLESDNINSSIYVNHSTEYGEAWFTYYNETLDNAYEPDLGSISYSQVLGTTTVETSFYKVELTKAAEFDYTISIELKNTDDCLTKLNLNTSYVDIGIGRQRSGTGI